MPEFEGTAITLPAGVAAGVKSPVGGADYASSSEVAREALGDRRTKRALHFQELASRTTEIDEDAADLAEGRVQEFRVRPMVARGRVLLARRRLRYANSIEASIKFSTR